MQCSCIPAGVWSTRSWRKATKFSDRVESVTQPATVPSCTLKAAKSFTVPLRRYSNSRRTGMPGVASLPSPCAGTAGRVGLMRLLA